MANELRFVGGNLLFVGGALAMAEGCCCGSGTTSIVCSGTTFIFPNVLVVDFGPLGGTCPSGGQPLGTTCGALGDVWILYLSSVGTGGGSVSAAYTQCANDPANCGGFSGTPITHFAQILVPCVSPGDATIVAVIIGGCTFLGGSRSNNWRDDTLAWRSDWSAVNETIPYDPPSNELCTAPSATANVTAA